MPRWFRARPSPTRPGLESWWWGAFFLPFLPSFFPSTSALTCTCSCTHIYASASAPRGFEPLRAEPCGLLAHLSSATQTRCFLMHLCNFFLLLKKLPPIGSMSLCNRHRRDSNLCGQSPMDFESISLAARTQCLLPAGDQVCRHRPVTYQPVLFSAFLRSACGPQCLRSIVHLASLSQPLSPAARCACSSSSRGYGATAARLTPDQKVGSSNLSGLIFFLSPHPVLAVAFFACLTARASGLPQPELRASPPASIISSLGLMDKASDF